MKRRVLLIDNYDSFTWNLVQALSLLGAEVTVARNDRIGVEEALRREPTHLVISPGPGRPEEAGLSMALIEALMPAIPVLGVCLGHQALGALLGASIAPARSLVHGRSSAVYHDGRTLYEGLPNPFEAGRYHSLALTESSLPDDLSVSACTTDGEIMGLRHRRLPAEGVQFHPESFLTPDGPRLLSNFLDLEPPGGGS
ncbi:MAG TPA: aminodeoxychorismate/anthranilate synthase component II [Candidatus Saccharimonadales bacterium]|nr:aminodeoxychorismate/anthranilate synthase component II [Candidatus Saccharimonadales bacterium]